MSEDGSAEVWCSNIGGETCASLTVNEDGTVSLMAGTPEIGEVFVLPQIAGG